MITVLLELHGEALVRLRVDGHARIMQGDISAVCAAVSGIVRMAAEVLAAHDLTAPVEQQLGVDGTVPERGALEVTIAYPAADMQWLRGVTDAVRTGLQRMAEEFPWEVQLEIRKGEQHGS